MKLIRFLKSPQILLLITVGILTVQISFAEKKSIKVKKAKGRVALVEFPDGVEPIEDAEYPIMDPEAPTDLKGNSWLPPRRQAPSFAASFNTQSSKTGTSGKSIASTTLSVESNWMFNGEAGKFEFGPAFVYESTKTGNTDPSSSMLIGPRADFNFVANRPGVTNVPGFTLTFGLYNQSAAGKSALGFEGRGGFFYKWFPFRMPLAIRPEIIYRLNRFDQSGSTTQTRGLLMQLGFMMYL